MQGFDVRCSWRERSRRQRYLQQGGQATVRNSGPSITDQRQSKLWTRKSKGRSKRSMSMTAAGPAQGQTGCEAAPGSESWGSGQWPICSSPSSLIQAVPNTARLQALYTSAYLTAAGPCFSFKRAGKKD